MPARGCCTSARADRSRNVGAEGHDSGANGGAAPAAIHDCWNRIGVRGDGSCPQLQEHVHCRNCPVFAAAAAALLDAPLPPDHMNDWTRHFAQPGRVRQRDTESAVIFRIGVEWLALPTALFKEVAERRPIHTLPHRRDGALLGLVNVRGELLICMALDKTLGLEAHTEEQRQSDRAAQKRLVQPRLLVVSHDGHRLAFPVDEVHGPHRFHAEDLLSVPATVGRSAATYTRAVLPWQKTSVGVLDDQLLFHTLARSLA